MPDTYYGIFKVSILNDYSCSTLGLKINIPINFSSLKSTETYTELFFSSANEEAKKNESLNGDSSQTNMLGMIPVTFQS